MQHTDKGFCHFFSNKTAKPKPGVHSSKLTKCKRVKFQTPFHSGSVV